MDRWETVGNGMGRAQLGRSDTEATRVWTEGKPWEIAWGELRGKERHGSNERVDRREIVGNSSGAAPLGRGDMEAARGWTEGEPWEIVWGREGHCGK